VLPIGIAEPVVKVAITFDITDNQRLVIGAISTGKIQDATREQIRDYVTGLTGYALQTAVARLELFQDEMAATIIADAEAMTKEATDE